MFVLIFIVMFTVADHIFCSKSMNYSKTCLKRPLKKKTKN